jgi:hypothetical protein
MEVAAAAEAELVQLAQQRLQPQEQQQGRQDSSKVAATGVVVC